MYKFGIVFLFQVPFEFGLLERFGRGTKLRCHWTEDILRYLKRREKKTSLESTRDLFKTTTKTKGVCVFVCPGDTMYSALFTSCTSSEGQEEATGAVRRNIILSSKK